jgi:catechol 2,3-dioxygenase-like lactoylglutathione lyase family enzyme
VFEKLRRPLAAPTGRGVRHLALCTDDMKATIDFYVDVLGMPLVQTMKVPAGLGTGPGDPNGIRLEFTCQPEDGEAPAVIPCITQTKAEARHELATLPDVSPEWIEMRLAALSE